MGGKSSLCAKKQDKKRFQQVAKLIETPLLDDLSIDSFCIKINNRHKTILFLNWNIQALRTNDKKEKLVTNAFSNQIVKWIIESLY